MESRVLMFLIGAVFIYYQVLAADDYSAELSVESPAAGNQNFLPALTSTDLQLSVGAVSVLGLQPVADCVIVGRRSSCNCSDDYIWTNNLCYSNSCCSGNTCTQDVSYISPLCIPKVQVNMKGSFHLSSQLLENHQCLESQLNDVFKTMNGFKDLTMTYRGGNTTADFMAAFNVQFETDRFQNIMSELENTTGSTFQINITGMVDIDAPQDIECYMSSPVLRCRLPQVMSSNGWNLIRNHHNLVLYNGTVVKLNQDCAAKENQSCMEVTLQGVTDMWQGTYECGFSSGSFEYKAKINLTVALLPDEIILTINPLTVDCSNQDIDSQVDVLVNATIQKSTEQYEVWWNYSNGMGTHRLNSTAVGQTLVYSFSAPIRCLRFPSQYVDVTFKNRRQQVKGGRVNIPVIYRGGSFCNEETLNGQFWPKTPSGATVINRTCVKGRIGYTSRTCEGTNWWRVISFCITQELNKLTKAAERFLEGLGSSQKAAMAIFARLNNCTRDLHSEETEDTMADIRGSINILGVMRKASVNITVGEQVLPDLVSAANNILVAHWGAVNASIIHSLSARYLENVEGLLKNIKINNSNVVPLIYRTENMVLEICSSRNCNMSVFGVQVSLNNRPEIVRVAALKNLTDKLYNNFPNSKPISLLVSVTVEDNNDSSLELKMNFPRARGTPLCVFWNTSYTEWSDKGCVNKTLGKNHVLCECNHLTSFSVLMSKGDMSSYSQDMITYVGLSVSIASLLAFFVVEGLVWSAVVQSNLSLFRHMAIINIAVFLLLGDLSFLASASPEHLGDTWCLVLTLCKHLFYLATFTWMLCLSMMLIHQLIFVFEPLRKTVFMVLSGFIGYVFPVLIVVSSCLYCRYTHIPYHDSTTCWLVYTNILEGSVYAFILPVGTIVLINLFSLVVVSLTLLKSVPDGSKADNKESAKSILKAVALLTPVFGVTWAIGFLLQVLDEDSPLMTVASYSFTILNSFQGFFILVMGCFAEKKIRDELKKRFTSKEKKEKSESTKSLTSTKDK